MLHAQALAVLRNRVQPLDGMEMVPLADLCGRVLAAPVVAARAVPAHTNAAVDGYGFRYADYDRAAGATLPIGGVAAAGRPLSGAPPAGHAVRILTGAAVPEGIDTVVMQEDCRVLGGEVNGQVVLPPGIKRGANIRLAGEDVAAGSRLIDAGVVLRPQDVAAIASVGLATASCYRRVRVAIVSTGDEVVRPGGVQPGPAQVFDANAPMLVALARSAGCDVTDLGVWPDDRVDLTSRLANAASRFDVILTSGGASGGDEDHMAAALDHLGTRHLWRLAIKPGRPMMLGQIGACSVVGLPGNPVAVFVCYLMYVLPMLRQRGGATWREPRRWRLPAAFNMASRKVGRREFLRGMLVEGPNGLTADRYPRDGSGLISGLRAADGFIEIPEATPAIALGDLIDFIPFTEFGIEGG